MTTPLPMQNPGAAFDPERVLALVEEAAGAVVLAGPEDREALGALAQLFARIGTIVPEGDLLRAALEAAALVGAAAEPDGDGAGALERAGALVTDMQRAAIEILARAEEESAPADAPAAPLPPLAAIPLLGSIEPPRAAPPPPAMEPARAAPPPAMEPARAAPPPAMEPPRAAPPPALEPARAAPPPPAIEPARAAPARAVARDSETIELLGDFLQEADEGVDKVDALLIQIEQNGAEAERINALFRVFHTIKGVAASLEVGEVTRLAHATETLLDQARSGAAELGGARLDRVFESAALMRRMLAGTRAAVERGTDFEVEPEVGPMIARLNAALAGANHAPSAAPEPMEAPPAPAIPPLPMGIAAPRLPVIELAPAAPAARAPSSPPPPPRPMPAFSIAPAPRVVEEAPAAAAPAPPAAGAPAGKLRETVKVDLDRVDSIVEMIGELIIVESMVVNAPEVATLPSLRVRNSLSQLTKISRDLQNVAMRMRMVPVAGVFQKMARMVRDLSRKTGKNVVLVQSGESAEMDRSMVERIEDPLVHMIRNSVDHGVEATADRITSGKAPQATIRLSAYHEGGSIVIEVADDGRGLNREAILRKARAQGLVRESDNPTDAEAYALIFVPGFSTASQVTEISGRGVGMDVVKRNIEQMRGRVTVTSTPGSGTTFRLILPLTLAIIDGMLVACGNERYIIPSLSIVESLKPTPEMVHAFADRGELINVRGEMLTLVRLQRIFGISGEERDPTEALVVVVETVGRKLALVVDDVITQQQVVIKPLGEGLGETDLLAGAAILPDGRVGLILNIDRIGGDGTGGQILHRNRNLSEVEAA